MARWFSSTDPRSYRSNPARDQQQLNTALSQPTTQVPRLPDADNVFVQLRQQPAPRPDAPLITKRGVLFVFDPRSQQFTVGEENASASIYRVLDESQGGKVIPWQYNYFIAKLDGTALILQRLKSDMQMQFISQHNSIVWVTVAPPTTLSLCFRFFDQDSFKQFHQEILKRLFETNNRTDFKNCPDPEVVLGLAPPTPLLPPPPAPSASAVTPLPAYPTLPPPPATAGPAEDDEDSDFDMYDDELEAQALRARERQLMQEQQSQLRQQYGLPPLAYSAEPPEEVDDDDREEEEEEEEEEPQPLPTRSLRSGASRSQRTTTRTRTHRRDLNKVLVVGRSVPRSFVLKESGAVQVFDTDPSKPLPRRYVAHSASSAPSQPTAPLATLAPIRSLSGQSISPTAAIMHHSNRELLLLNASNPGVVLNYDIEHQRVVNEWKMDSAGTKITSLAPLTKDAAQTDQPQFLAVHPQGYAVMDPRLSGRSAGAQAVSVDGKGYAYAPSTKPLLTCAATTSVGQLALGSGKGDVRFYDASLSKRAKTQLQVSPGDPIIGMDSSKDGRYLLITYPTYILLLNTEKASSTSSAPVTMYDKTTSQAEKLEKLNQGGVVRLDLTYRDVMKVGGQVAFNPAKFDYSTASAEERIITSTGPFLIIWNLRQVLTGRPHQYRMKRLESSIISGDFLSNSTVRAGARANSIVAALDNDVAFEGLTRNTH